MDISKRHTQTKLSKFKFLPLLGKVGLPNINVLLAITDRTLPFSGQLQNIQWAYVAVIQEVLPDDATASSGAIS